MAAVESREWEACHLIGQGEVRTGVGIFGISYSSSGTHECVVQTLLGGTAWSLPRWFYYTGIWFSRFIIAGAGFIRGTWEIIGP